MTDSSAARPSRRASSPPRRSCSPQPVDLGAVPAEGQAVEVTVTGDLTLHGVTKSVEVPLQAKLENGDRHRRRVAADPVRGLRHREAVLVRRALGRGQRRHGVPAPAHPRPRLTSRAPPDVTPLAPAAGRSSPPDALPRPAEVAPAVPTWVRVAPFALAVFAGVLYLWNLDGQRVREHLLRGGGPGGGAGPRGVVLRLDRRRGLHHRRQAAAVAVADGALGPAARPESVRDPPAPGARGRRDGRRPVPRGQTAVRTGRRGHRGRRVRADAGRRADVPLQQPRRGADAAARCGGVGARPRPRERPLPVADPRRRLSSGFAFLTKYLQAYLVLPAFALTYLVAARGDAAAPAPGARRWRASPWWCRRPGGSCSWS